MTFFKNVCGFYWIVNAVLVPVPSHVYPVAVTPVTVAVYVPFGVPLTTFLLGFVVYHLASATPLALLGPVMRLTLVTAVFVTVTVIVALATGT